MATYDNVPETKTALDLWRALFGDGEGYLCLTSGERVEGESELQGFREKYLHWPEGAERADAWCGAESEAGREVYFCTHLLLDTMRSKDNAAPTRALWADGDGAQVPEDMPEPSITVESSPGREQFYWLLTVPVDPVFAETLNRRLTYAMGADETGWDLTQLLRPLGTRNHKYPESPEVVLQEVTGEVYDPEELDRLLPPLPDDVMSSEADLKVDETEPPVRLDEYGLAVWRGDKPVPKKEDGSGEISRSLTLFKIAVQLAKAGASKKAIRDAIAERNDTLGYDKYLDRPAERFEKEYARIADKAIKRAEQEAAGVTRTDTTDATDTTAGGTMPRVLPPAVPFPVDALPEIPRRLVREGALTTGTTPDMVASMVLSALGSAVGTTRRLRLTNKWKEFAAVWTCVVSLSGDKKSPALDIAMEPIYEEQSRLFDVWEREKEEYKRDLARWKEEQKQSKEGGGVPRDKPEEPKLGQVFVQDITIEQLGEVLVDTPRGVAAIWDELSGFFTSADQYKSGGKGNERTKYLSMWKGSPPLKVDRRGSEPVYAKTPLVSVTGTIQPSILPVMKRSGAVIGGDDGMAHRFLFSYPESPVIYRDRTGHDVSEVTSDLYAFLHELLRGLEHDANGKPVEVHFSEDGGEAYDRHNETFRTRMYLPGVPESYGSAIAKLASSQLARVSLLFCLCRSVLDDGEETVTAEDVDAAAKIIEYFVAHMRRVHAVLFSENEEQQLLRVLSEVVYFRGKTMLDGTQQLVLSATDFRKALDDAGAHDLPERADELSKKLLALSESEPRLRVRTVRPGKGRGLEVTLVPPAMPAHDGRSTPDGVGSVGGVGASNAGETATVLLPGRGGAAFVKFALRQHGSLFPEEIAEKTGLAHGTVKKIVSQLRSAGEVKDTGKTQGQARQVMLPTVLIDDEGGGEEHVRDIGKLV